MDCTVRMTSEEYGSEDFHYETIEEGRAAMDRLEQSIIDEGDGIERTLTLILDEREVCGEQISTPCGGFTIDELEEHLEECDICQSEHAKHPLY